MRQHQRNISKLGYGPYFGKVLIVLVAFLLFFPVGNQAAPPLQPSADSLPTPLTETAPKQTALEKFSHFIQKITEVDTTYIRANHYLCTTTLLGYTRNNSYYFKGKDENGQEQMLKFTPKTSFRVGPHIGYSLLFLGYTLNIGTESTSGNSSNINLSIYAPYFGIDYSYERSNSQYRLKSTKGFTAPTSADLSDTPFPGLTTKWRSLYIYYIFNHKRFSYTAAYSQSTQQLRSSGSFILGFNHLNQNITFDYTRLPTYMQFDTKGNNLLSEQLKISNIAYRNYSIGIGYSYNWAFARNFLFNLTLTPTLGYNLNKGQDFQLSSHFLREHNINFDLISRSSIIWNTGKYYIGADLVHKDYRYKQSNLTIRRTYYNFNVYLGVNFLLKKAYRKHNSKK